jgi:hypothetical protein
VEFNPRANIRLNPLEQRLTEKKKPLPVRGSPTTNLPFKPTPSFHLFDTAMNLSNIEGGIHHSKDASINTEVDPAKSQTLYPGISLGRDRGVSMNGNRNYFQKSTENRSKSGTGVRSSNQQRALKPYSFEIPFLEAKPNMGGRYIRFKKEE